MIVDTKKTITIGQLMANARLLLSEHGENPEYDRAIVELVLDAAGLGLGHRPEMAQLLGVKEKQ